MKPPLGRSAAGPGGHSDLDHRLRTGRAEQPAGRLRHSGELRPLARGLSDHARRHLDRRDREDRGSARACGRAGHAADRPPCCLQPRRAAGDRRHRHAQRHDAFRGGLAPDRRAGCRSWTRRAAGAGCRCRRWRASSTSTPWRCPRTPGGNGPAVAATSSGCGAVPRCSASAAGTSGGWCSRAWTIRAGARSRSSTPPSAW